MGVGPSAPTIGTAVIVQNVDRAIDVPYTAGATGTNPTVTYTATSSPGSLTATGASPIRITGLTAGTAYTFTVSASTEFGTATSAASNSVTAGNRPGAPTIGTATGGNAQATVTYTAGAAGTGSTTFTAISSPGNVQASGASPITVTGLTNGQAYTFTVRATNSYGFQTSGSSN
jgi:hypothetical protein